MSLTTLRVDYDRISGRFAVWTRENATILSIVLVLIGLLVTWSGYIGLLQSWIVVTFRTILALFVIVTILVGFEIVAFENAAAKIEAKPNAEERVQISANKAIANSGTVEDENPK